MIYRWQRQTTAVITDARDGHGPLPLRVPEEAPPVVLITPEEGIAIKHKLLLLSPPRNSCTLLLLLPNALVTLQILLELITTSQGPENGSKLCHLPAGICFC